MSPCTNCVALEKKLAESEKDLRFVGNGNFDLRKQAEKAEQKAAALASRLAEKDKVIAGLVEALSTIKDGEISHKGYVWSDSETVRSMRMIAGNAINGREHE